MNLIGTTAVTQGPQGTVSSVVAVEDERTILKSLRDIKDLLDRFNPSLITKFSIKSLVVENTFSEMRSGATDTPLQLEFDYIFSKAIKERLKRKCCTPFTYFTATKSYYPQVFTTIHYKELESNVWPERLPEKKSPKHDNKGHSRNSAYISVCSRLSNSTASRFPRAE